MEKENECKAESNDFTDDADKVQKLLTVVVKRRKTVPAMYMDLSKQITALELSSLVNSRVQNDNNSDRETCRSLIQRMKPLTQDFSIKDLEEVELKLLTYYERIKKINEYLEKRKNLKRKSK